MNRYDLLIVGTGPAGLAAAFEARRRAPKASVLLLDKERVSTGGLRNDCKMNFTYPIGFPGENWEREQAEEYLELVKEMLSPEILPTANLERYCRRAEKLGVEMLKVEQTHLGTDGGLELIKALTGRLNEQGVEFALEEEMRGLRPGEHLIETDQREIGYGKLILAPGRQGFRFLQRVMDTLGVSYVDNIVDVGMRIETRVEHYPIVHDYYDPKFIFPGRVRTFCTNSGNAYVVQERYESSHGEMYPSVNGHAFSKKRGSGTGLANFAMLKTVRLTEPLASGQQYAETLGIQSKLLGGGRPLMQRVGDFRLGKRSKESTFNDDLFDFEPTLSRSCPGDISLAMPAKILRTIWKSLKHLDTIVPGVLHPGTIMYYPEIKLYANKPQFADRHFRVVDDVYFAGDGAGTSRGITAAWASGIRAAEGAAAEL
jgi:hypothetical protein